MTALGCNACEVFRYLLIEPLELKILKGSPDNFSQAIRIKNVHFASLKENFVFQEPFSQGNAISALGHSDALDLILEAGQFAFGMGTKGND